MLFCLLISCFLLQSLHCGHAEQDTFYITGLFQTESRNRRLRNTLGVYPRAAARYAVRRINRLGLLDAHNTSLVLREFSSSCVSPASGAHGLIEAVRFAMETRRVHNTSGGEK